MRRYTWLLLALAGCAGPDSDPVDVAERFHAFRIVGDDRGIHGLLAEADRAAVPLDLFPAGLPPRVELKLLGWGDAPLDSASLLDRWGDTAAVRLHVVGLADDTLRLVATHHPRKLWLLELDRLRWRVAIGLAETALLDSLATAMRAPGVADDGAVQAAGSYLGAAERHPDHARPTDVDFARSTLRKAAIVDALRVDLRVAASFTGTLYVSGEVENPTSSRIATLRMMVRDVAGREEKVELWEVEAGTITPVMQLTTLRPGPLKVRLDRVQVF